jgi:hypothetical protein
MPAAKPNAPYASDPSAEYGRCGARYLEGGADA